MLNFGRNHLNGHSLTFRVDFSKKHAKVWIIRSLSCWWICCSFPRFYQKFPIFFHEAISSYLWIVFTEKWQKIRIFLLWMMMIGNLFRVELMWSGFHSFEYIFQKINSIIRGNSIEIWKQVFSWSKVDWNPFANRLIQWVTREFPLRLF